MIYEIKRFFIDKNRNQNFSHLESSRAAYRATWTACTYNVQETGGGRGGENFKIDHNNNRTNVLQIGEIKWGFKCNTLLLVATIEVIINFI